jgi:hypothetical protein
VFCITVAETSIPDFKSLEVSVAGRTSVVLLVNTPCIVLPWLLVIDKPLLLTLWIVPVVTLGHAFEVVGVLVVAAPLAVALALPHAASSIVSSKRANAANNFHLLRCVTTIFQIPS